MYFKVTKLQSILYKGNIVNTPILAVHLNLFTLLRDVIYRSSFQEGVFWYCSVWSCKLVTPHMHAHAGGYVIGAGVHKYMYIYYIYITKNNNIY